MTTSNHEICKRFIENPGINPVKGGRLIKDKGPYNGYIRLCEKLGYNVDHLKVEVIIPEPKILPIVEDKPLWNWMLDMEEPIPISYPVIRKYKIKDIEHWRAKIRELSNININLDNFTNLELYHLYDLYNKYFFNSALPRITLDISTNLTKTAGKCQTIRDTKQCQYTIFISKPVFARLNLKEQQSTKSGGLECYSRLECLQLVLEHEMIHLAIQIHHPDRKLKDKTIYASHGALFRDLVYAYFGQTKSTHQIGNIIEKEGKEEEEKKEILDKTQVKTGMIVSFLSKNNLRKGVVVDTFPVNAMIVFLDGERYKIEYAFLRKIDKDDTDYPLLLRLKNKLNEKLVYLNRLNIGDKVQYKDRDQIINGIVVKTYPKSNAVGIKTGDLVYKVHYSSLVILAPGGKIDIVAKPMINTKTITTTNKKDQFRVGDKVKTNDSGKMVIGTITKKNPVNAVVKDAQGKEWSINYNILDFA